MISFIRNYAITFMNVLVCVCIWLLETECTTTPCFEQILFEYFFVKPQQQEECSYCFPCCLSVPLVLWRSIILITKKEVSLNVINECVLGFCLIIMDPCKTGFCYSCFVNENETLNSCVTCKVYYLGIIKFQKIHPNKDLLPIQSYSIASVHILSHSSCSS